MVDFRHDDLCQNYPSSSDLNFLHLCTFAAEAEADELRDFLGDRSLEYCAVLQPLDTREVNTICHGGHIGSHMVEGHDVVRMGPRRKLKAAIIKFSEGLTENTQDDGLSSFVG